jgi:hypothetical protein
VQDNEKAQEDGMDQEGEEEEQENVDDQEIQASRLPHPRVHQAIQRDHLINMIICYIQKTVTTRS